MSTLPRLRLGAAPVCLTFADLQEFAFPRLRLRATFAHLAFVDWQASYISALDYYYLMVAEHLRASIEESAHFFNLCITVIEGSPS